MATKEVIFLLALFALIFVHVSYGQEDPIDDPPDNDPIEDPAPTAPKPPTRDDFPKDFIFGTTSSAYQFEGAARDHGKGDSIWDVFTANHSDKVKDGSNGDIAEDFYHRYPDLRRLEDTSICGSRKNPKRVYACRSVCECLRRGLVPVGRTYSASEEGFCYLVAFLDGLICSTCLRWEDYHLPHGEGLTSGGRTTICLTGRA
ncbi:hypothetical protein LguiB_023917 [Lonicera macranthoides]